MRGSRLEDCTQLVDADPLPSHKRLRRGVHDKKVGDLPSGVLSEC